MNKTTTYSTELDGITIIINNVPVDIDKVTGEECFSISTQRKLENILKAIKNNNSENVTTYDFS